MKPTAFLRWGANYHYDANGDGANNDVSIKLISVDAIPEPASVAFAAIVAGAVVLRRRRRGR